MAYAEELDKLFDAWQTYFGAAGRTFVRDGVIGIEERWFALKPRILFLLKEPHNRNNVLQACSFDLRVLFRESGHFNQNCKTVERRLANWACDLRAASGSTAISRQTAFFESAVINLCKLPGGAVSQQKHLTDTARREQWFITRQIELLNPHVVVCGNTFSAISAAWGGFVPIDDEGVCFLCDNRLWIDHYHPAARSRIGNRHAMVLRAFAQSHAKYLIQ